MELAALLITGIISRFIPHPANITAVGAVALYSGSRHPFWKSFGIVSAVMLVTDSVFGFHPAMWATYGSLAVAILLGKLLTRHPNISYLTGISLLSSIVFFILTNFAVWSEGYLYPKTVSGLISCYIMAVPFLKNSVIGDVLYTIVIFYAYAFTESYFRKKRGVLRIGLGRRMKVKRI